LQIADGRGFFRGSEFDGYFFVKIPIKFTPSKEYFCKIYFLPAIVNEKKITELSKK